MQITIARLRIWIVLLATVLVVALAVYYFQFKIRARRLISDLPGKLGVDISQTSDSYTLSQTGKNGRTSFTIKASKAVKFKDGDHYTLHDVVITIYGAQGDRNDRIAGKEFNYDQKTGIIAAQGPVQIDMRGADLTGNAANSASPAESKNQSASNVQDAVHVDTSGLVFNQKTQVATTTQYVDFRTPRAAGHSTGATYDVQKGLLVLDTKVEITSSRDGKPILLRAAHAEFLHNSMQAFLLNPLTDFKTDHVSSDQAIVYFRKDGSAEHIDAQGHIHVKTDGGQDMTSRTAKLLLDQKSQLQRADLSGGINFVSTPAPANANAHTMHGSAVEGTVEFGPNGALHHAQARNAVSFVDQQRGLNGDPQGSATREMRAAQVDIDFSQNPEGHAIADKLLAVGGATAVLHTIPTKGPAQNTTVKGDQLLATLQDGKAITSLHGAGHTSVLDISPTGASNLSTGDVLQATFASGSSSTAAQPKSHARSQPGELALGSGQVQTFVQEGNVVIIQTPAPGASGAPTHATAHRADYTADNQLLRLTGAPRVDDGATDLAAATIDFHRDTSIVNADGNVKATYLSPKAGPGTPSASSAASSVQFGGQGLTHVISNNAILDQAHGEAIFRGQARLWQGANSVAAPVIEIHRNPEILKAYGDTANPGAVLTVIANASSPQRQADVSRVHSRQLLYTDADRKALFTGSVTSEDANGVVHCDQAEVFLTAANQNPGPKSVGDNGQSRVDRIVATGHVVLQQPGCRGTGEKLLYTSQDGKFVLTGTSAVPPHLYDQTHGNVSGDALIFNSRDDSVSVTGGQSKAVSDTRTTK
jgi:lipopolysaccharide export system protein LptA